MAGPPVEVQVRVNTGGSVAGSVFNWKVSSSEIVTCPVGSENRNTNMAGNFHIRQTLFSALLPNDIIYFAMGPTH